MSKSDPSDMSRINLTDTTDEMAQKVKKAKTDPEPLPSELAGLDGRAEALNLVTIFAALAGSNPQAVLAEYGGQGFRTVQAHAGRTAGQRARDRSATVSSH